MAQSMFSTELIKNSFLTSVVCFLEFYMLRTSASHLRSTTLVVRRRKLLNWATLRTEFPSASRCVQQQDGRSQET